MILPYILSIYRTELKTGFREAMWYKFASHLNPEKYPLIMSIAVVAIIKGGGNKACAYAYVQAKSEQCV